jgi:hypothetical protein
MLYPFLPALLVPVVEGDRLGGGGVEPVQLPLYPQSRLVTVQNGRGEEGGTHKSEEPFEALGGSLLCGKESSLTEGGSEEVGEEGDNPR